MIIHRQGDWLSAMVGDELVMMSAEKGKYIGLSDVGVRVWELIETPNNLDDICARLEQEYDVAPERCRTEVKGFLDELAKHGAIAVDIP